MSKINLNKLDEYSSEDLQGGFKKIKKNKTKTVENKRVDKKRDRTFKSFRD